MRINDKDPKALIAFDFSQKQWNQASEQLKHLSYSDINFSISLSENIKYANPAFYAAAHAGRKDDDGALEFLEALIDKMKLKDIKFKDENGLTLEKMLKSKHENGHISDVDFNKLNEKIQEIEELKARLHKILKKTLEYYSKNPSGEAGFFTAVINSLPNGVEKNNIEEAAKTTFQSFNKYKNTDGNALTRILNRFADAILSAFGKSTKIDEFLGNLENTLSADVVKKVTDDHPDTERSNPKNYVDRLKENLKKQKDIEKGIGADKPISVI